MTDVDLAHAHCINCFNFYCSFTDDPVVTCDVIECDLLCGARFHRCKLQEHRELCSAQKVPCINAIYGCTTLMLRCTIPSHLEVCPASVIHCTMEWNRWPVYSSERQSHQPTQILSQTNTEQLDIALALRDQRMLTQSMRASRKTRQILTTSVNRKHPAVPLDKQLTNHENVDEIKELQHLLQTMQDEKTEEEHRRARTHPGLRDSICLELIKNKQSASERQSNGASGYDPPYYPPEVYESYPYLPVNCSHCNRRKSAEGPQEGEEETGEEGMSQDEEEKQVNGETNGIHDSPKSQHSSGSSEMDLQPPGLFVTSSTTGDLSAAPSRGYAKLLVIQPQSCLTSFSKNGHSLGLDLSMESITRYQTKPDSMYTFLCAQEFRRDEFANHFKNVHSDIHGGLNGWLEQRCPLAPYGCTYSQRRFYPGMHGAKIVHSQTLESFGLQMEGPDNEVFENAKDTHPDKGVDYLSSLPFELLRHLFRYLDSFSLCNTAMVSKLLREVCSSLLEEKGMVVMHWEKHGKHWQISCKAWCYSTSFTSVNSWGFEDYAPIGQHLRSCSYNVRTDYPDKVRVMGKEAATRKKKLIKKEERINFDL